MRKIIFATSNEGKMREIRKIFEGTDFQVVSMKEAGIISDISEDGASFEENALIKARTVMKLSGSLALADDSGLEVDFLDKAPGIYSARYMGEDTPYTIKNQKILDLLKDTKPDQRTARFVCAIAAVFPDGKEYTTRATLEGIIGREAKGENGFGFDPIFYLPEFGCYSAELPLEKKNEISHRGKALQEMKEFLQREEEEDENIDSQ